MLNSFVVNFRTLAFVFSFFLAAFFSAPKALWAKTIDPIFVQQSFPSNHSAKKLYEQAAKNYLLLFQDRKFQALEVNWLKTIGNFQNIATLYPKTEEGIKALYTLGSLNYLLFHWNGKSRYLENAKQHFETLAEAYPTHYLADDALFALEKYYRNHAVNPTKSLEVLQTIISRYPNGDMTKEAKIEADLLKTELLVEQIPSAETQQKIQSTPNSLSGRILSPNKIAKIPVKLLSLQSYNTPEWTRLVLQFDQPAGVEYSTLNSLPNNNRLEFFLKNVSLAKNFNQNEPEETSLVSKIKVEKQKQNLQVGLFLKNYKTLQVYDFQDNKTYKLICDIIKIKVQPPYALKNQEEEKEENKGVLEKNAPANKADDQITPLSSFEKEAVQQLETMNQKMLVGQGAKEKNAGQPTALTKKQTTKNKKGAQKKITPPTEIPEEQEASNPELEDIAPQMGKMKNAKSLRLSLSKVFGLKVRTIVLDPGHGGKDPGATAWGLQEKDLTLSVAKEVVKILKIADPDLKIFLTRETDKFLKLEERTQFANNKKADLFVSIHGNSAESRNLKGIETYYLNLTSDVNALATAAKENAGSLKSGNELQSILKSLLTENKLQESSFFAKQVQYNLTSEAVQMHPKKNIDLGVKQAPFFVLIGAEMPSILIEVGFISNPTENDLLRQANYKKKIANGITRGILTYKKIVEGQPNLATKD